MPSSTLHWKPKSQHSTQVQEVFLNFKFLNLFFLPFCSTSNGCTNIYILRYYWISACIRVLGSKNSNHQSDSSCDCTSVHRCFKNFWLYLATPGLKIVLGTKYLKIIVNINKHCNFMKLIPGNLYFLCDRPMGKFFGIGVETLKGQNA